MVMFDAVIDFPGLEARVSPSKIPERLSMHHLSVARFTG